MAAFNQDVPHKEAPSFLGYSKSISQPDGNKALGIALEGIGKAFEGGVAYVDRSNKQAIDAAIDQGTESNRDAQISTLETLAGISPEHRVTSPELAGADYVPKSLIRGNASSEDVPENVASETEAAVNGANSLASANGSNKIPLTYYRGRDDTLRKDLRARYPGYRDYIDTKMGNTGNAYMNSLLSDINSRMSSQNRELNKDIALIDTLVKEGETSAPFVYQKRVSGEWDGFKVRNWAAEAQSFKRENEKAKAEVETMKATNEIVKDRAMENVGAIADRYVNRTIGQMADGTYMSMKQMNSLLQDYADKKITQDDPRMIQLLQSTKMLRQKIFSEIMADISKPSGTTDRHDSLSNFVKDPKAIEDRVKLSLSSIDGVIDLMEKGEFPLAKSQLVENKAILDNATNNLLKSEIPNVRSYMLAQGALKNIGGEALVTKMELDVIGENLTPDGAAIYKNFAANIATQKGEVRTLDEALGRMRKAGYGASEGAGPSRAATAVEERKVIKSFVNLPTKLSDPEINDIIKTNIIYGSYGEQNSGLLLKFENERKDAHGNVIPGRNAIFQMMTTPAQAEEVRRLAGRNPELWKNYTDWVNNGFQIIYGDNVRDVTELAEKSAEDKRLIVKYNGVTSKFELSFTNPIASDFRNVGVAVKDAELKRLERQVNAGLDAVSHIAKTEGTDPNAYILERMIASNAKVAPDSIAGKMLRAVLASNKPKEESKE